MIEVIFFFYYQILCPDLREPALDVLLEVFTLPFESLRPNLDLPLVPLVGSRSILPVLIKASTPLAWLFRRLEEI